ncbi:hypothetical protein [Fodinicola feengrottensis]|uniref:hypothetical protein n=1 Tax=Fodinicola feengrottensis TaxID=435914 RepID=UPI0013D366E1|nr:hypothetical protein [Fodinicola feengrottensis]
MASTSSPVVRGDGSSSSAGSAGQVGEWDPARVAVRVAARGLPGQHHPGPRAGQLLDQYGLAGLGLAVHSLQQVEPRVVVHRGHPAGHVRLVVHRRRVDRPDCLGGPPQRRQRDRHGRRADTDAAHGRLPN